MAKCGNWQISVCSWSMHADIQSVMAALEQLGIDHVHLETGPACETGGEAYLTAVSEHAWTISATMLNFLHEDYSTLERIRLTGGVAPDEHWESNLQRALRAIDVTRQLGVRYLTFHAGFIDHRNKDYILKFYDRITCLADAAGENGVGLLLETGQETAADLLRFLEEINHPVIGVNFDPANMILYDKGDPIEAMRMLGPWIKHLHIKDANRSGSPDEWGTEVPWGDGQVNTQAFLQSLTDMGYSGALAIEREFGDDRLGEVKLAIDRLQAYTP